MTTRSSDLRRHVFGWAVAGAILCAPPATAAESAPAAAPPASPPKACASPEHRQFDFWLGDWQVTDPQGRAAGKNWISLEHDGCVLHEHWIGEKGGTGSSFSIYDGAKKRWHQSWVDNTGTILELEGGFVNGRMVLEGKGSGPKGEPLTNRIAWEKLPDGRVRQTWTVSSDGGSSWTISFDGFYTKK